MGDTGVGERRAALVEQIRAAFSGVGRRGGVSLHEADVIDRYGSARERARARRFDRERRWQEVPGPDIEHYHWALSFLDPVGFRYYMPAYMVWALHNYETSHSASVDSTIYALDYSDDLRAFALERYAQFSREQSQAVCAFLRFMAEDATGIADELVARRALERYWNQFC